MQQQSLLETVTMGFKICMQMAIAWYHVIDRFSVCLHQEGKRLKLYVQQSCMGGIWQHLLLLLPACIQGSAGAPAVQQTGLRGALIIPLHRITVTRPVRSSPVLCPWSCDLSGYTQQQLS